MGGRFGRVLGVEGRGERTKGHELIEKRLYEGRCERQRVRAAAEHFAAAVPLAFVQACPRL